MENKTEIADRFTVIYMYELDNIKYIFNRSVQWDTIIGKDYLAVFDVIGEDYVKNQMQHMGKSLSFMPIMSPKWFKELKVMPLETHYEWDNIKRRHQSLINERKRELSTQYDAAIRYTDIDVEIETQAEAEFDKRIVRCFREYYQDWFFRINQTINEHFEKLSVEIDPEIVKVHTQIKNEINENVKTLYNLYDKINKAQSEYKIEERRMQDKIENKKRYMAWLDNQIEKRETCMFNYTINTLHENMKTRLVQYKDYMKDHEFYGCENNNINNEDYEEIYGESY